MSKNPLPHLDKPDEETIDKMKYYYHQNQCSKLYEEESS